MTYTLATWALWMVAAALIGAVVGWMLRGLRRAEGSSPAADERGAWAAPDTSSQLADDDLGPDAVVAMPTYPEEVERLRAKLAELEGVVVERNRLQWELDEVRAAASAGSAGAAPQPTAPTARVESTGELAAQRDEWASKAVAYEQLISELRVRLWNSEARLADLHAAMRSDTAPSTAAAPPTPDLEAGALVLGPSLRLDDLTVVEGIGPKIAGLCQARGITTWWSLANTSVDTLREVLAAAGPKFQVHDPSSWPDQARLLATGQWVAFQTFTERLRAGRSG